MFYSHLGRAGLRVSRLFLGTMNFGTYTDKETSFKIMDYCNRYKIDITFASILKSVKENHKMIISYPAANHDFHLVEKT